MTTYDATLDQITREAKALRPGRAALTIITAPFFFIGWLFGIIWLAVAMLWSAGVVGFRRGRNVAPRGE